MNETSTVAEVTREGAGQAQQVAERARDEAGHVMRQASDQARSAAEEQARRLAEMMTGAASELRTMAERSDRPDSTLTSLAREGAGRVEELARQLDDGGLDGAMSRTQRYARRRPGMFLTGCFAAGLLVGRFVRNDGGGALRELHSSDGGTVEGTDASAGATWAGAGAGAGARTSTGASTSPGAGGRGGRPAGVTGVPDAVADLTSSGASVEEAVR